MTRFACRCYRSNPLHRLQYTHHGPPASNSSDEVPSSKTAGGFPKYILKPTSVAASTRQPSAQDADAEADAHADADVGAAQPDGKDMATDDPDDNDGDVAMHDAPGSGSDVFKDKVIALTGALSVARRDAIALIQKHGGVYSEALTAKVGAHLAGSRAQRSLHHR